MRELVRDKGRLEHILDSIEKAIDMTQDVSFEDYKKSVMVRYATVKCVEIVGEASYKLTHEFRAKHPEVNWNKIIAMRHILVHGYYQTDDSVVWNVLKNDLPRLKEQVKAIYEKEF